MNFKKQLKEGLLTQNPVLVQLLGMCSTMAITTTIFNGLGMGVSVLIILTCSNVVISLLRKIIPDQIRIAAYVVVIAGFVTMVDLLLQAFLPDIAESLGVFIPPGHRLHPGAAGHERHPGVSGQRVPGGTADLPVGVRRDDAHSARGRLPDVGLPHRPDAVGPRQG